MKTTDLAIDLLCTDGGTQSRASINEEVVQDYAELVSEANHEWPFSEPVDVFHDGGDVYHVADGFHRVIGCSRAKRASIPCRIHKGTARDALLFGMKANVTHGLRRSNEDKRHCVSVLLDSEENFAQKQIAELAAVSLRLVKTIVAERNPASIAGKGTPPKQDGKGQRAPSTPNSGESDPFDEVDQGGSSEDPDTSAPVADEEESEPKKPNKPNGKTNSTPPKQYERSHWKQKYDQSIGPLVRLVDKIANNIGEADCESHRTVQEHLNIASEEMTDWMGEGK